MTNANERIANGDIVFYGGERFQVFQASPVRRVLTVVVKQQLGGGALSSWSCEPGTPEQYPVGSSITLRDQVLGYMMLQTCSLKTIPVLFGGGELDKNLFGHREARWLHTGDRELYRQLTQNSYHLDLEYAAIVRAKLAIKQFDVKGFKKTDLMAYCCAVHGELDADCLLRMTSALEGKPWIRTSNREYFGKFNRRKFANTLLYVARLGSHGRKFYGLGEHGPARAKAVLERLGEGPAREVK